MVVYLQGTWHSAGFSVYQGTCLIVAYRNQALVCAENSTFLIFVYFLQAKSKEKMKIFLYLKCFGGGENLISFKEK